MTRAPRTSVLVLSRWTGYCLPCDSAERPLVLVWSGPAALRTRLLGPPAGTGELRLTCGLCGGTDAVGWEDEPLEERAAHEPADEPADVPADVPAAGTVEVQQEAAQEPLLGGLALLDDLIGGTPPAPAVWAPSAHVFADPAPEPVAEAAPYVPGVSPDVAAALRELGAPADPAVPTPRGEEDLAALELLDHG